MTSALPEGGRGFSVPPPDPSPEAGVARLRLALGEARRAGARQGDAAAAERLLHEGAMALRRVNQRSCDSLGREEAALIGGGGIIHSARSFDVRPEGPSG